MSNIRKSQDGSAYWAYVFGKPSYLQNGDFKENVDANPDQLSEQDILIQKSVLSHEQEEAIAAYYHVIEKGVLRKLTPRQRQIWKLRFFRWNSDEDVAKKLGITIQAVYSHLARAGQTIKKEIERHYKKKGMLRGEYFNSGFKKGTDTIGETNTDRDFEERLDKHEKEIDKFLKQHPELRKNQ